jgi:hypothetical protein
MIRVDLRGGPVPPLYLLDAAKQGVIQQLLWKTGVNVREVLVWTVGGVGYVQEGTLGGVGDVLVGTVGGVGDEP